MKVDELTDVQKAETPEVSEDSSAVKEFAINGIAFRIRPTVKGDTTYYVLDYRVQGRRKLV